MSKFCVNCAYHIDFTLKFGENMQTSHFCGYGNSSYLDPVTGEKKYTGYRVCSAMREGGAECGPDGKLYKEKP